MAQESNRAELERELSLRKSAIKERFDRLEGELASTPSAIRSSITRNPWVGIAALAGAGLLVGLIVSKARRRSGSQPFHQQLVEQYISAVGDDVRRRVKRGKDPGEAVRAALDERAPVIIYAPDTHEREEKRGLLREAGDLALKTALGFVIKSAIDMFSASFSVEKLQALLALEEERQQQETQATMTPSGDGAHRMDRGAPSVPRSDS